MASAISEMVWEDCMITNVRIELSDEQRRQWKDSFGEPASRKNIKVRVSKLVMKALGGEESDDDEEEDEEERPKKKTGKKKFRLGGRK
jgi:hypothetical protein